VSIGKYLTNMGVITALIGALGTARQTKSMPRDWRRFVVWGVWAAGLVLAVAGAARQPEDEEFEAAQKDAEREAKAAAKRRKRR